MLCLKIMSSEENRRRSSLAYFGIGAQNDVAKIRDADWLPFQNISRRSLAEGKKLFSSILRGAFLELLKNQYILTNRGSFFSSLEV